MFSCKLGQSNSTLRIALNSKPSHAKVQKKRRLKTQLILTGIGNICGAMLLLSLDTWKIVSICIQQQL